MYIEQCKTNVFRYRTNKKILGKVLGKKSYITPIFESGDKNVRNYRPIFKLSIIPKVFEAIITKKLSNLVI